MLKQVADGVWVRQSEWVWSNAVVVHGDAGLVLVDPGIGGSDLDDLADDVDRLGVPVVAGFSTHPHWDHLLWHSRFGGVPRYASPACVELATAARERAQAMAAQSAAVAEGPQVAARLAADRAYLEALRRGEDTLDVRLERNPWLSGAHQSNLSQVGQPPG